MSRNYLFVALLAAALWVPFAEARLRVVEQAIEASPQQLVLPTRPDGGLSVRPCPSCAPKTLTTNSRTIYQVGDEPMSLERFAQVLRENPRINLTVMTDARTGVVTRVRVQGTPVSPGSR